MPQKSREAVKARFQNDVNDILSEFGLVYALNGTKVEKVLPAPLDDSVRQAKWLLAYSSGYEGADAQFGRALGHLNRRPDHDTGSAIKDAVGAVEAVARVILGDASASGIVNKLKRF